ncbi:Ger(x)C family spore germination protein [Desulfitobacterium metallireducens]|uniref:Germination protein Ger(X)C n=1 Tax=Desulfitobacterium metallireducens DSM 15288 TaxID=871968 RepID=W0E8H2_9FIRM|nr:Ger(x)C family spore germination protein [Desulfitobacterium metallireducens]AHF05813.1 germination protein Ger(x)C [Desulfitobacterium metallireducens DSM 15288]
MKKYIPIYIICILLSSLLTGCWNRKEINTLAIVQAFGIDRTDDDQVNISAQILKPSQSSGDSENGGQGVWVVSSTGETVFDAIRNASFKTDRKLFFPHNKVIIIGEDTAKTGITPLVDFLRRDHEVDKLSYVFIAKGTAKDILIGEHEQEKIPGKAIEGLSKTSIIASHLPKRELKDLLSSLGSKTGSAVVPGIEIQKKNENGASKEVVVLDNTAIFKKDKIIGWFDHTETRGLLWVLGEIKSGIIVVKSPEEEAKNVSLEIIRTSTQLKPQITDGKLSITVEIEEEGNLAEQFSEMNLTRPDTFAELERRQIAAIEEEINVAITKAQAWNVDIFKFGEEFHQKYPQEWPDLKKNWEEEFPKIKVNLEVIAHLSRVGLSTTPVKIEESEKIEGGR